VHSQWQSFRASKLNWLNRKGAHWAPSFMAAISSLKSAGIILIPES
jgi:hypothetical protein